MLVNLSTAFMAVGVSGAFGGIAEALASQVMPGDGSLLVNGF